MADYVDPKRYDEGAEQARLKAISYFEKVVRWRQGRSSPNTPTKSYLPCGNSKSRTLTSFSALTINGGMFHLDVTRQRQLRRNAVAPDNSGFLFVQDVKM